jgi:hypothetical protein
VLGVTCWRITFMGSSTSCAAPSASHSRSLRQCLPGERRWTPASVPCREGTPFPISIEDGLRAVAIVDAAYRSAERGGEGAAVAGFSGAP